MSIVYKLTDEWASPTYYEHNSDKQVYDECDASIQAYWVISYDIESDEVVEWLERYTLDQEDDALARIKELNEEGE